MRASNFLCLAACANAAIVEYDLEVVNVMVDGYMPKNGSLSVLVDQPLIMDSFNIFGQYYQRGMMMLVVNNQSPGPTIEANEGDIFKIIVRNRLINEMLSIHWHGMKQFDTSFHDGAYRTNDCGTAPGFERTYEYVAYPCGTRFYHGHSAEHFTRGLAGMLIVHCKNDPYITQYSEERSILIFDVWKRAFEANYFWSPHAGTPNAKVHAEANAGISDFNGTHYTHSVEEPASDNQHNQKWLIMNGVYGDGSAEFPYPEIAVSTNKCYRFRVVSAMSSGWYTAVQVIGHTFKVIALNGHNIAVAVSGVSTFVIGAAERLDFLLCADAAVGKYVINAEHCDPVGPCQKTSLVLVYDGAAGAAILHPEIGTTFVMYEQMLAVKPFAPEGGAGGIQLIPDDYMTFHLNSYWIPAFRATYGDNRGCQKLVAILGEGADAGCVPHAIVSKALSHLAMQYGETWEHFGPPLIARCATPAIVASPIYTFNQALVLDILFSNVFGANHGMHLHGYDMYIVDRGYFVDPTNGDANVGSDPSGLKGQNHPFFFFNDPAAGFELKDYCSTKTVAMSPFMTPLFANFFQIYFTHGLFLSALLAISWGCTTDPALYATTVISTAQRLPTDMVYVRPNSWAVVRVQISNPGIWPIHCHQQLHVASGMFAVFDVLPKEQTPIPASAARFCGCNAGHPQPGFEPKPSSSENSQEVKPWVTAVIAVGAALVATILTALTCRMMSSKDASLSMKI